MLEVEFFFATQVAAYTATSLVLMRHVRRRRFV